MASRLLSNTSTNRQAVGSPDSGAAGTPMSCGRCCGPSCAQSESTHNEAMKRRLLVFLQHYLPGSLSGGPVRSVANMVQHLGDDVDFMVACMDRDLGQAEQYPGIEVDTWQRVGKGRVIYLSKASMYPWNLRRAWRLTLSTVCISTASSTQDLPFSHYGLPNSECFRNGK